MRRRFKFASLFFDEVRLERGVFRMYAGPGGHFSAFEEPDAENPPQWQTPSQRGADQRASFTVGIGREHTPGVLASTIQTAIASPAIVSWAATLYPFTREFPPGTDWIHFARTANPTGAVDELARRWTWYDESNAALQETIPETFVRGAVIKNANRDLVVGAADGLAVSLDPLHSQVAAQRFRDGSWKPPASPCRYSSRTSATCPGKPSPTFAATEHDPLPRRPARKLRQKQQKRPPPTISKPLRSTSTNGTWPDTPRRCPTAAALPTGH